MYSLTKATKQNARLLLEALSAFRPCYWDASHVIRTQRRLATGQTPDMANVRLAVQWLKAAQDASGDGVSWGYRARVPVRSGLQVGWMPPYPETTGYIIETFLEYARRADDIDCRDRARRMADWELSVQLPDGGIQGGYIGSEPVESSTFVTGQVIFGWVSMYELTADAKYLQAARRAGDFLLSCLDDRGRFQKGYTLFAAAGPKAFEARTGWALARLGRASGDGRYSDAALRIAEFAVSCQQPNGWFAENDLQDDAAPLTHTIGYVLEGLWETAEVLRWDSLREPVLRTLAALQRLIEPDGFLAGRWKSDWQPAASWCCMTGSCQIARVFLRARRHLSSPVALDAAARLLRFVTGAQAQGGANPAFVGGIQGSYPFDGGYNPFVYPNWATKFYADAVMEWCAAADAGRQCPQPDETSD